MSMPHSDWSNAGVGHNYRGVVIRRDAVISDNAGLTFIEAVFSFNTEMTGSGNEYN